MNKVGWTRYEVNDYVSVHQVGYVLLPVQVYNWLAIVPPGGATMTGRGRGRPDHTIMTSPPGRENAEEELG